MGKIISSLHCHQCGPFVFTPTFFWWFRFFEDSIYVFLWINIKVDNINLFITSTSSPLPQRIRSKMLYNILFCTLLGLNMHFKIGRTGTGLSGWSSFNRIYGPTLNFTVSFFQGKMVLHYGDLIDGNCLVKIINETKPTEIYNLGAQSHVKVGIVSIWSNACFCMHQITVNSW